jgi:hypothetical protein
MAFTIRTFTDLLHIVETHPKWRRKLVEALFPEIDVSEAFRQLAESQQRLTALIERMDARTSRVESDVTGLKTDVAGLKVDVGRLRTDVGGLKGITHELNYRDKAVSIFGRYLKRGHNATHEVADRLQAAVEAGDISEQEFGQVLAADLLWGGQAREAEGEVILVVEASWMAEVSDVERAAARAGILRKIGLVALPVVAGREWTPEALEAAHQAKAVITTDGSVDAESWRSGLASAC